MLSICASLTGPSGNMSRRVPCFAVLEDLVPKPVAFAPVDDLDDVLVAASLQDLDHVAFGLKAAAIALEDILLIVLNRLDDEEIRLGSLRRNGFDHLVGRCQGRRDGGVPREMASPSGRSTRVFPLSLDGSSSRPGVDSGRLAHALP